MIDKNPLVSIIVPTYKRTIEMLDRAVQSILKQTYDNFEIIIVDDNGKQELSSFRESISGYICKLLETEKRITYLQNKENLGGALSRNIGIKAAKGELIAFLDDDDIYLSCKIEHQVKFMIDNGLNCSFTDLSIYNESDKLIDKRVRKDIASFDKEYLIKYHLTKIISGTETFMISRKLLLDIGGFDNAIVGQEFFLMFKILNYPDLRIGYFESDDIKAYRTKDEAISTGPNKILGEKQIYIFKKKNFNLLSKKEIKYIKCRHRAVMAVAYKRNKKYLKAFWYLLFSFFTSPLTAIKEALMLKQKIC